MRQVLNVVGTLLMLVGVSILIFVGVSYARGSSHSSPHWSKSQQKRGRVIAARLRRHQNVAVPKRLQGSLPPAGREPAIRIVIPKIQVNSPVVETPVVNGVWPVADWAVGHLPTSPNPGVAGNMALSAHDDIKGEIFKRLGELSPGDTILVYTRHAVFRYAVVGQQTVDPSDTAVLNPTKAPTVTLITCAPYWVDTQRLVVQAVLKSGSPK